MNHYYRITAYHKNSNVCLIADSNGKFEKLWQFSSFFVCKGFEIISVAREENFSFGNIPKANADSHHILIQHMFKHIVTYSFEYTLSDINHHSGIYESCSHTGKKDASQN